jgi:hypothetical protein
MTPRAVPIWNAHGRAFPQTHEGHAVRVVTNATVMVGRRAALLSRPKLRTTALRVSLYVPSFRQASCPPVATLTNRRPDEPKASRDGHSGRRLLGRIGRPSIFSLPLRTKREDPEPNLAVAPRPSHPVRSFPSPLVSSSDIRADRTEHDAEGRSFPSRRIVVHPELSAHPLMISRRSPVS